MRKVIAKLGTLFLGICWFSLLALPRGSAQQGAADSQLQRLFGSDPKVRADAKLELLGHPDPLLLPALLKALPASRGTIRDDLLEILDKYQDPRKIPVLMSLESNHDWENQSQQLSLQLSRLGAPAAQAILDGCSGQGENYGQWAAGVLSWMHQTGAQFLIQAVQSEDTCEHTAGQTGLLFMFADADYDSLSRADIQLAADAAIDGDDKIRTGTIRWLKSLDTKPEYIDFSGVVDELIEVYRSNAPADTMVRIARLLSDRERPRVTRFMRAAVHAPNPEIQQIANQYLSNYGNAKPEQARVANPRTPKQKIEYLGQLEDTVEGDVNVKIVPFLEDADPDVRAAAATRLGDINAPNTDPHHEGVADAQTALPALREALQDHSPKVRAAAVTALGQMKANDETTDSLIAATQDSDKSVVLAAIAALREIASDSAVRPLTAIYRSDKSSAEMKTQALLALEAIGSPDSLAIFLEDLSSTSGPSPQACSAVITALGKRPDPGAFEPIRKALESSQPSWVRQLLVTALGATKNPQAFDTLVVLSHGEDAELASKAVDAMGKLGDRRAIPILAALLKNPNSRIRVSAVYALRQYSDFAAPPELIAALHDKDSTVQIHASSALVSSHDPKGMDALIAALPSPTVMHSLGEAHETRAVPALIAILQNPSADTGNRAAAATTLGQIGDLRAVDPLIAALLEDNLAITRSASMALGQLKSPRAIEPLKEAYARWQQKPDFLSISFTIQSALTELGAGPEPIRVTGTPSP
jgi:HEAT repeat protein